MDKSSQTRLLDLLDHAYRVSDDPAQFDALLENANSYFFNEKDSIEIAGDLPKYAEIDPHIDRHISRLERLISQRKSKDRLGLSLDRHAQITLSAEGRVLSANEQAELLLPGIVGHFINDLPLSIESVDTLRELTRELIAGVQSLDRIIHLQIETDEPTPAFGFCRAVPLNKDRMGLQVSLSYFTWSDAIFASLTSALGLTESEGLVLRGVLLGQSQKHIAETRGRSVDTIKAQSKSILRKAGCSKMTDLAHLCTSIAYVIGLSEKAAPDTVSQEQWITPRQNLNTVKLTDGRTVAWYEYGDPDGRPVLFVHGFFQGPFFLDDMKRGFLKAGLRVICPSRPAFGYSSPPANRVNYRDVARDDALALLSHLGITESLIIIGAHGGSNHAFYLARALGERVSAVVIIGGRVPTTREHLAHMTPKARTISTACRHAPSVMKMIATLGIKTYRERGIKAFLQTEYAPSPIDRADVAVPARFVKLCEGMFHMTAQGGDTFVSDGRAQMLDWTDDFKAVKAPQFWIHGRHCHVTGAHLLEDYVTQNRGGAVTIVEDAGFNLLYQAPERVMETILAAAAVTPKAP